MRDKQWFFDSATTKFAACDVDDPFFSSVYKCQEDCRKCKTCRFFQYYKILAISENYCNFFETSEEEVRGRALEEINSGYRDTIDGTEYEFVVNGPEVCGKPILIITYDFMYFTLQFIISFSDPRILRNNDILFFIQTTIC